MDPNFAYAYTLLGHEYVVTEELEKAMSCYRNAVRIDSRHYIAWWVYERSHSSVKFVIILWTVYYPQVRGLTGLWIMAT